MNAPFAIHIIGTGGMLVGYQMSDMISLVKLISLRLFTHLFHFSSV